MKRIILFATCGLMACAGAFAQQEDEPKLVVKPSGRILMDAGVMHSTDESVDQKLNDGVAIPDARVPPMASGKQRLTWVMHARHCH